MSDARSDARSIARSLAPWGLGGTVAREVEMVVSSLAPVAGERTIWLDPYGRLWHGAPSLQPPHGSWQTIGTFRQPSRDAVTTAVLGVLCPGRSRDGATMPERRRAAPSPRRAHHNRRASDATAPAP